MIRSDRQKDRQKDRQTDRQKGRQAGRTGLSWTGQDRNGNDKKTWLFIGFV